MRLDALPLPLPMVVSTWLRVDFASRLRVERYWQPLTSGMRGRMRVRSGIRMSLSLVLSRRRHREIQGEITSKEVLVDMVQVCMEDISSRGRVWRVYPVAGANT